MKAFEKWLLPPTCVFSNQLAETFDLSDSILQTLNKPNEVCPVCCEPSKVGSLCGACITQPPAFSRTQVGFYFEEPLTRLIYDLKYQQNSSNARLLAEMVAGDLDSTSVQALIPIPTHPLRRRKRGYNQAELIAKALGHLLDIPVLTKGLKRTKDTPPQTHLTAIQRQNNLTQVFKVDGDCFAALSSVALVDDVITTGATMQKAARMLLKNSPIEQVQAWAIAKTK